jgi:hypothetical protein
MLGLSLQTFTLLHVLISLVGIATGFVVLAAMFRSQPAGPWTATFLATTILTSVTGFMFPFVQLLPSHMVGILSLVLLAAATYAFYGKHLIGAWRPVYIATAIASLYLNVFVLIVQAFQKVGPLKALAPTQSELPFVATQGVTLILFGIAGLLALRAFKPTPTFAPR